MRSFSKHPLGKHELTISVVQFICEKGFFRNPCCPGKIIIHHIFHREWLHQYHDWHHGSVNVTCLYLFCLVVWIKHLRSLSCSRTGAALKQREAGPHPGGKHICLGWLLLRCAMLMCCKCIMPLLCLCLPYACKTTFYKVDIMNCDSTLMEANVNIYSNSYGWVLCS